MTIIHRRLSGLTAEVERETDGWFVGNGRMYDKTQWRVADHIETECSKPEHPQDFSI